MAPAPTASSGGGPGNSFGQSRLPSQESQAQTPTLAAAGLDSESETPSGGLTLDLPGDGVDAAKAGSGDAMLTLDADSMANAGLLVTDANGNPVTDVITFVEGLTITDSSGHSETITDMWDVLSILDDNQDGVVDANDPGWAYLGLHSDENADGVMDPGELGALSDSGVTSVGASPGHTVTDEMGNERTESTFTRSDGTTGTAVSTAGAGGSGKGTDTPTAEQREALKLSAASPVARQASEASIPQLGDASADGLAIALLKLQIQDPNNSVDTHNAIYDAMSDLRQSALDQARAKQEGARSLADGAQSLRSQVNPLMGGLAMALGTVAAVAGIVLFFVGGIGIAAAAATLIGAAAAVTGAMAATQGQSAHASNQMDVAFQVDQNDTSMDDVESAADALDEAATWSKAYDDNDVARGPAIERAYYAEKLEQAKADIADVDPLLDAAKGRKDVTRAVAEPAGGLGAAALVTAIMALLTLAPVLGPLGWIISVAGFLMGGAYYALTFLLSLDQKLEQDSAALAAESGTRMSEQMEAEKEAIERLRQSGEEVEDGVDSKLAALGVSQESDSPAEEEQPSNGSATSEHFIESLWPGDRLLFDEAVRTAVELARSDTTDPQAAAHLDELIETLAAHNYVSEAEVRGYVHAMAERNQQV